MSGAGSLMKTGNFTPEFDRLVNEAMKLWKIPGFTIAVINGDSTCAKAYGFSRMPHEKAKPETLFHCASMTKAFTAAAVSFLVDDNENYPDIQWTTPVSSIIRDDFVLSDPFYTEHVTIEDILSHRSGLPDVDDACFGIHAAVPDTPKTVTRKLRYLPLNKPLRTEFQYSNVMYTVAAHMVETVTGKSMQNYLREKIWEPLGMNNTFYGMTDLAESRRIDELAKGYCWYKHEKGYIDIPWNEQPEGSGAGEMISNAFDVAKWLRAMILKAGPISEESHKELVRPRTIEDPDNTKPFRSPTLYALGWEIDNFHGETVISHDGSINGFSSKMLYVPRLDWGFVSFGNSHDAYAVFEKLCWGLIEELFDVAVEKRFDWDTHSKKEIEEMEEEVLKTVEQVFPDILGNKLPPTLPLENYTGTYMHMAFGALVLQLKDGELVADASDRTWRQILTFSHVSGEFFTMEIFDIDVKDRELRKTEFCIGADGKVARIGIEYIEDMDGELVWFEKIS